MVRTGWRQHLLWVFVGGLIGCQGSVPGGGPVVETSVEPREIVAGGQATVTCNLRNGPADAETSYRLEPDVGWQADGDVVTVTQAGNYVVRCEVPELDLFDPVGAELAVAPGEPVQVAAHLEPPVVPVFQSSTVTCAVEDGLGNAVEGEWDLSIVVVPGLSLQSGTVVSETPGTYEVRCQAPSNPELVEVPAELEVTA
ncbi:MAG: hypothetical protein VX938_00105, partial [Myxococcota bacterium]|nr:hypothetical protein [Myxococcota bacterium]